jgi:hypothetical protein
MNAQLKIPPDHLDVHFQKVWEEFSASTQLMGCGHAGSRPRGRRNQPTLR